MYIKRKLEDTILGYLEKREILAIVGPRQGGKTTLLRKIQSDLKNSIFLSFEDIDDLELFEQDIKSFAKKYLHYRYIFIDEFQYSKNGGKRLKYLYDTFPNSKIIISGSSAIDLTIHAIRYLVGRVFVFSLYQLDFDEFLAFRDQNLWKAYDGLKQSCDLVRQKLDVPVISDGLQSRAQRLLEEFILWGGYPRVVLAETDAEKETVLRNIYNTYFLRDIRDTLGLVDDFRLAKLIQSLSFQIGQLVEYSELSKVSEYDYLTLKKYMNILEKTFICQPVKPFFTNKRKEIVKNPKIYFFDTGLRNYAVKDFRNLNGRDDKGFLYENFLFTQFLKQDIPMHFWRTKSKDEVDFVLEVQGGVLPIESKSRLKGKEQLKALETFVLGYRPKKAVIFNEGDCGKIRISDADVYCLPHWMA